MKEYAKRLKFMAVIETGPETIHPKPRTVSENCGHQHQSLKTAIQCLRHHQNTEGLNRKWTIGGVVHTNEGIRAEGCYPSMWLG